MLIKNQANPFPGSALMEEVPEINLDLWEIARREDTGSEKIAFLDEPPGRLCNQWVKDRMAYYLRVEPVAAIRDVALDTDYPVAECLRFSKFEELGARIGPHLGVLLSNPEREGLA